MSGGHARAGLRFDATDALALGAILAVTLVLALVFYTALRGNDETVYTRLAYELASGRWPGVADVYTARFGIFGPTALLFTLVGPAEWVANAWTIAASLGEIALVYAFARSGWGRGAAILAATLLAFAPLHVVGTGALIGDAPLALFLTMSFCAFHWGERAERGYRWYALSGLAFGGAFWVKQQILVCGIVFVVFPLLQRRWKRGWTAALAGVALALVLYAVALHFAFGSVAAFVSAMRENVAMNVTTQFADYAPFTYFYLLFHDYRATFLIAYVAVIGAGLALLPRGAAGMSPERYVVIWGAGLILVMSFGVISLDPLRFFPKQNNYILVFLAPLALLSGFALSRLARAWSGLVMAGMVAGSLVIASADQLAERTLIANLRPAAAYVRQHGESEIYASHRFAKAIPLLTLFETGVWQPRPLSAVDFPEPLRPDAGGGCAGTGGGPARLVIVDPATMYQGWHKEFVRFDAIPPCWRTVATLRGTDPGIGSGIIRALEDVLALLPPPAAGVGLRLLGWFVKLPPPPQPATVYEMPGLP